MHQASNAFEERDHMSIQAFLVIDPADDMQMIAIKKDKLWNTMNNWIPNRKRSALACCGFMVILEKARQCLQFHLLRDSQKTFSLPKPLQVKL